MPGNEYGGNNSTSPKCGKWSIFANQVTYAHSRNRSVPTHILILQILGQFVSSSPNFLNISRFSESILIPQTSSWMSSSTAVPVNCCALIRGMKVEEICNERKSSLLGANEKCTCADYFYCRLVVVTAFSSNHFEEAQDMIHSAQRNVPNTTILVYDLGLNEDQRRTLSDHCHVEVRTFPFEKYPPHFRALALNEAWKPIIINELTKEYDVILYGDASLRILKQVKDNLLPYLMEFPLIPSRAVYHPVIPVTPPEMYNYLGLNLTREQAWKAMPREIQSTMMCVWATELMKDKFLKHWVDCAMHEECMSPKGYIRKPTAKCHFDRIKEPGYSGEFVGCMRCQSIINILLYREFGGEVWKKVQRDLKRVWTMKRAVTHLFREQLCPVHG